MIKYRCVRLLNCYFIDYVLIFEFSWVNQKYNNEQNNHFKWTFRTKPVQFIESLNIHLVGHVNSHTSS